MYQTHDEKATTVIMDRGENTQCTINLHGCTITSWRFENWELLFVSRHANYNNKKDILGGIRIDFPVIGDWKFGPINGFAQISKWELIKAPRKLFDSRDIQAVFRLVDNPHTRSFWNFNFEIINTITLTEFTLEIETKITNTSPVMPVRFNLMFPIYLQIPNIKTAQIVGLKNCKYDDETIKDEEIRTDRRKLLEIKEWIHRIYINAPNSVEIAHLHDDRSIRIIKNGLNDFLVWNPWTEHGTDVDDFRAEQYKDMLCVGMGHHYDKVRLVPGAKINTFLKLQVCGKRTYCTNMFY